MTRRIENAAYYDQAFSQISGIRVPPRRASSRRVYHLYMVFAERRDDLYAYVRDHGISAKIHYPTPIYRQPALAHLGHKLGDFPVSDRHAGNVISFPVDQHISRDEQDFVIDMVRNFYAG